MSSFNDQPPYFFFFSLFSFFFLKWTMGFLRQPWICIYILFFLLLGAEKYLISTIISMVNPRHPQVCILCLDREGQRSGQDKSVMKWLMQEGKCNAGVRPLLCQNVPNPLFFHSIINKVSVISFFNYLIKDS